MYVYVQNILKAKTLTKAGLENQTEAYCDGDLFAYYRGKLFAAVTSKFSTVSRQIITHPYSNGDVICNIFWPKDDCITIVNNQFQINLLNGEAKLYIPKSLLNEATTASE